MTANSSEDKQRKFREWRSLDCLREEIDTNKVIDNWVTPLENYRDSSESGDSYFDPVLCEFGEFTRLMLWYYSVLTTGLFPHWSISTLDRKHRCRVGEKRRRQGEEGPNGRRNEITQNSQY